MIVMDTGIGMSAPQFAQAVQHAVRLEAGANLSGGSGLGLAIASSLPVPKAGRSPTASGAVERRCVRKFRCLIREPAPAYGFDPMV